MLSFSLTFFVVSTVMFETSLGKTFFDNSELHSWLMLHFPNVSDVTLLSSYYGKPLPLRNQPMTYIVVQEQLFK